MHRPAKEGIYFGTVPKAGTNGVRSLYLKVAAVISFVAESIGWGNRRRRCEAWEDLPSEKIKLNFPYPPADEWGVGPAVCVGNADGWPE